MEQNNAHLPQTRMNKWSNYRAAIKISCKVREIIEEENKSLAAIQKKILKLFPNYSRFNKGKKMFFPKYEELKPLNFYKNVKAEEFVKKICAMEKKTSFNYLKKINFSSGALQTIINQVQDHKVLPGSNLVGRPEYGHSLKMKKPKKILLDGDGFENKFKSYKKN